MSQNGPNSQRALEYQEHVKKTAPKSRLFSNCLKAFLVGGSICTFGQILNFIGKNYLQFDKDTSSAFTAIVLIFLGATLTGVGIYDKLGTFAGAGSVVPITGFANSVVSPAIEFKQEGFIMGVGANMFKIAGPVIVYGTVASVVYGIVYWITTMFCP